MKRKFVRIYFADTSHCIWMFVFHSMARNAPLAICIVILFDRNVNVAKMDKVLACGSLWAKWLDEWILDSVLEREGESIHSEHTRYQCMHENGTFLRIWNDETYLYIYTNVYQRSSLLLSSHSFCVMIRNVFYWLFFGCCCCFFQKKIVILTWELLWQIVGRRYVWPNGFGICIQFLFLVLFVFIQSNLKFSRLGGKIKDSVQ